MKEKLVTVLITLNYNDSDTTIDFIKNMQGIDAIDKIVISDNKSTDLSVENIVQFIKLNKIKNVDLIVTEKNGGYAYGNNYAFEYVKSNYNADIIFFANPDVYVEEKVFNDIISFLIQQTDVGAVGCTMNNLSTIKLKSSWNLPKYKDCIIENFIILSKLIDKFRRKNDNSIGYIKADVVQGSFFGIRSDVFQNIKGFDESTFLYYEENFLGHRIKENGYQSYILNSLSYEHKHSTSINKSFSSVKQRLKIAEVSREKYCVHCLKKGKISVGILRCTHFIGTFNYIVVKNIMAFLRK